MPDLPTGTITFLFTDIQGSTNLARALADRWPEVLQDHHAILRAAIRDHRGVEVRPEGDAFFAVFASAADAVAACVEAQRNLTAHPWPEDGPVRVRMGLHSGEGRVSDGEYVGLDVHHAARVAAAGHGGQVLLSEATRALVAGDLPDGVGLRDLGAHRLKDFEDPQPIHQLAIEGLPADFPPLKARGGAVNLPTEVTSFVGRERELEEIRRRLLDAVRLLTLTGPGGSGKTRLAVRAAATLAERFPDGAHFVELASTADAGLVPSVIASALGIREEGPRPLLDTLRSELRDRSLLLVLDNFEQVLDAAPVVGSLLSAAPGIGVLVTSRGPLRLQGEQELPVPPLGLPAAGPGRDPSAVARSEAVALFADRAAAIDPAFELTPDNAETVAAICARLDGLPLAIELAASRVRLMSPEAMLRRLDRALPLLGAGARDLPARQRTLRDAIAWSYDLLPPETAPLFRRICVFAGGFDLEAVEAVGGSAQDLGMEPLDGLEMLLDNALVRRRDGLPGDLRFDTLRTIREFGLERLEAEEGAEAVRRRHALHFLSVAERTEPELRGPASERALDLLELDHDNLRGALAWALERDEAEIALRIVAALWRFWHLRGHLTAGRRWATGALALPSAGGRTRDRMRALWAGAGLAYWQTDPPAVRAAAEEALAIAREVGDQSDLAEATYHAAFWQAFDGDFDTPARILEEARERFERVGNRRGVADALFALGIMERLLGRLEEARPKAEEALRIHRELGDAFGTTGSLFALGRVAAESGDLDRARSLVLESLDLSVAARDRTSVAIALDNLADQEMGRGNHRRALRIAGASQAVKESVGGEAPPAMLHLPDPRDLARGSMSDDEIDAAWDEGRAMGLEEVVAFAGASEDR